MVGQKGNDSAGEILVNSLKERNVNVDFIKTLKDVETGIIYNYILRSGIYIFISWR